MKTLTVLVNLFILLLPTPTKAAEKVSIDEALLIVVDKKNLVAKLKTWPPNGTPSINLGTFRVATGKVEGDKQVEGDNKTPEGIYFSQSIINGNTLPAKYGPFAIPLNFPNPIDLMEKKTGYGIWLHGVKDNTRIEQSKITEGCIAFYNQDIDLLSELLSPRQSMIMITNDILSINNRHHINAIANQHNKWLSSWQDRDIDTYISLYDDGFSYKRMNKSGYKRHKARIFSSYNQIHLEQRDTRIIVHNKYGLSISNQFFRGDKRYKSQGRKHLYWRLSTNNQWRIIVEDFKDGFKKSKNIDLKKIQDIISRSPSTKFLASRQSSNKQAL